MVNVVFLHPDLGIGGAERLVVDAALALKSRGHRVRFVTAHHDPAHCFGETRDGTLPVTAVGDWLPRSVLGGCYALCAYVRMVYAALYLVFFSGIEYEVVVCDQISACVPVLKWGRRASRVLFYCHFPDQLLTARQSWLKRAYRAPIDWLEETTTGMADRVLVNSRFTANVFRETFSRLRLEPDVLYPSVDFADFDKPVTSNVDGLKLSNVKVLFVSINRYERKKQLSLAVFALAKLRDRFLSSVDWGGIHLVLAGGYDDRVSENVEHYRELTQLVDDLGIGASVTFLRSVSDADKKSLLHSCTALVYTPDKEHFGIVPVEAMAMSRPVIAVNSGGPKETVLHNQTGFLCSPTPHSFADAMQKFIVDKDLAREMGRAGSEHVRQVFSYEGFVSQLDAVVVSLSSGVSKEK